MKFLIVFQLLVSVLGAAALAHLAGAPAAKAYGLGAGLMLLNLVGLVLSWPWILAKKLVALSVGVIVLKFAILGSIVYVAVIKHAVHLGWFAAGLATVVLTIVVTALVVSRESPEEAERLGRK